MYVDRFPPFDPATVSARGMHSARLLSRSRSSRAASAAVPAAKRDGQYWAGRHGCCWPFLSGLLKSNSVCRDETKIDRTSTARIRAAPRDKEARRVITGASPVPWRWQWSCVWVGVGTEWPRLSCVAVERHDDVFQGLRLTQNERRSDVWGR